MRLSQQEVKAIKRAIKSSFGDVAKVWLFGSRVDDSARGGDIDLFVESPVLENSWRSRSKALIGIQDEIGEQKIDLVVHQAGEEYEGIHKLALETGVELV